MSFDRGMEDAYYGFGPSSRRWHNESYMEGYRYGESLIEQQRYDAEMRRAEEAAMEADAIEAQCAHYGHEPYGAGDQFGARCYCGKVRWLQEA